MPVRAGRMRHKITIQQSTQTVDSIGGVIDSWSTYKIVWAGVEPQSGREFLSAQQVHADLTIAFRIRYVSGVTPKMRISWNSRTFDIESVVNPMERNEQLLLMCREIL